jgi:hypothetical protein
MKTRRLPIYALLVAGLVACGAEEQAVLPADSDATAPSDADVPEQRPKARAPGVDVSVPFDVGAVMRTVHFAFRRDPDGATFSGGHSSYSVRASATQLEVTPWHAGKAGATATFAAAIIRRGTVATSTDAVHLPSISRTGKLVTSRGGAVEHLENRDDGIEQSWSFESAPAGRGDLELRIAVGGLDYSGETIHGLHFVDPVTQIGLRYGRASWIDARGAITDVAVRYEAGAIVLVVPDAVLEASAFPAVLDPVIGPEVGTDNPVNGFADASQSKPAIASDGSSFLVVWSDARAGGNDIWAARVSSAGAVSDTAGIAISTASNDQLNPAVTFGGGQYFVTWDDQRDGVGGNDIYGARVSTGGVVADAGGIAISVAAGAQVAPSVAFGGNRYLVVWQDARSGTDDVWGQLVTSATGAPFGSNFTISTAVANAQQTPDVAFDGTNFMTVWADARLGSFSINIFAQRVSTAGAFVGGAITVTNAANNQTEPAIAFNGSTYLVAWVDARLSANTDIYGARVTTAGVVSDAAGIRLSTASGGAAPSNIQTAPDVSTVGGSGNFAVVWQDFRNSSTDASIYGTRVTNAGAVSDIPSDAITTVAGSQLAPALAYNGTNYLVAWTDPRNGADGDIFAARVSTTLAVNVADFVVSRSANTQRTAAVAYSGSNYLVVWQDFRAGATSNIYGTRVSTAGAVLDASGIAICTATGHQLAPTVAFDGTQYMVAWEDLRNGNSDIFAQRVSTAGALTGGNITVSTATNLQQTPSIARNASGTGTLVAWADTRSGPATNVYGARLTTAGAVSDASGIAISTAAGSQTQPAVGHDGTTWVVAWSDTRSGTADIFAARVTTAGTVSDASGVQITAAADAQTAPAVTAVPTIGSLVVWADDRAGAAQTDVYGQLLGSGSLVGTEIAISTATGQQLAPSVSWDGNFAFVVWSDGRGATNDIYGARVTSSGALYGTDAAGISIAANATEGEQSPRIASDGAGKLLASYHRFDPTSPLGAFRVRSRLITNQPNGIACTSAAGCDSGFCVDGVCCSSSCGGGITTDCQACSTAAGAPVSGTCGPASATTTCRTAAGACDAAETCNGTSLSCPTDVIAMAGTVCRAAAGTCDVAETCDGSSSACPADTVASAGTVCRADAGPCDVAETCNGSTGTCPADAVEASGTQCRAVAGACDVAETCDGSSNSCPPDSFLPNGTSCRAAAGICDLAEACSGSAAACPGDAFQPASVQCRPATGPCDVAENCRGNGPACPGDSVACCETDCGTCAAVCGNGTCSGGETCATCAADCGACPAYCGDAACNGGETCATCARDCGACPATCGNGVCSGAESCATCPADCGACPVLCGDARCDAAESCGSCARDCGPCAAVCGDGTCGGGETCSSCTADCGACVEACGNGVCAPSEACWSCPSDCGSCPGCGDSVCTDGETCASCSPDCGVCARCGDGSCLGGETCGSCPSDCGQCPGCGDGSCLDTESCLRCPADCGACNDETCGDGVCSATESCSSCDVDCCQSGAPCGHDICTTGTPLQPSCDSCAALVCVIEPGCCSSRWDAVCVALTATVCGASCGTSSGPTCGDGVCGPDESCLTCGEDCLCGASCGDGVCRSNESCLSCAADCGACATCGDGTCAPSESCLSCAADCGGCTNTCGDGTCSPLEDCAGCPADCGACPSCGDGLCSVTESCTTCSTDCGACVPQTCGNHVCEGGMGELCSTCPTDCGTCAPLQHALCEVGEPLARNAHACVNEICELDPFCCAGGWDVACVAEVESLCGLGCGTCGNATCDATEDCQLCADCGTCTTGCGDGACSATESCDTCPFDCAPCTSLCGNQVCEYFGGETCGGCVSDCGTCASGCGNGLCSDGETCGSCPLDCGPCAVTCGDGVCDPFRGESCTSCAADCGSCGSSCGDGACTPDESSASCTADCGPTTCSHSVCQSGAALDWSCDPCVRSICDADSYCCVNGWDATCIWDVFELCRLDCTGNCGDGICHFEQGESCASCPNDCGTCTQ